MNSPRVSSTNYMKNPLYRVRNYFTRRRANTDPKNVNKKNGNTKRRNRRGAITYKNAARIKGTFQKPPLPPYRARYIPQVSYPRGPIYMNNNDDPSENMY